MGELWRNRRKRRRLLVALVLACSACWNQPASDLTTTRYIDTICADDRYTLAGSARRTTGLAADACGFVLGPDAGELEFAIPLTDLQPHGDEVYEVSVLVRFTATDGMGWSELTSERTDDAMAYYSVSSTGEELEVIDVRIHAHQPVFGDCG